jgi:ATP-dependent Clp protease ATP-binding subunit ClpA
MYERFSDKAKKVMALANQEAQRFNHEYIGTEHILLGLVKEGTGVGAEVLKKYNIDLRLVRLEVEKLVKSGPDMITMGKLPQTPRAKKVIEYAIKESADLKHNHIGTEHLLLGLLQEHYGVAAQVLRSLHLSIEQAREEIINIVGSKTNPNNPLEVVGINTPGSDSVTKTVTKSYYKIIAIIPRGDENLFVVEQDDEFTLMRIPVEMLPVTLDQEEDPTKKILVITETPLFRVPSIQAAPLEDQTEKGASVPV